MSPREVYAEAKRDGVDVIQAIRLLRNVFGLSLTEAKEATGAADVWSAGQEIKPGALVYWETRESNELHLLQVRVKRVMGSTVEIEELRRFRVLEHGLDELPVNGSDPASVNTTLLAKPLSERVGDLLQFIDQRFAGVTATKQAV